VEQADAEADSLSVLYVCVCQGPCLCCVCASVSGSLSVLFFRVCVTESFCVPSYLYNADMLSYHKSYFYLILYHVFCIIIYVVTAHYIYPWHPCSRLQHPLPCIQPSRSFSIRISAAQHSADSRQHTCSRQHGFGNQGPRTA
jgi:hypothetical protein